MARPLITSKRVAALCVISFVIVLIHTIHHRSQTATGTTPALSSSSNTPFTATSPSTLAHNPFGGGAKSTIPFEEDPNAAEDKVVVLTYQKISTQPGATKLLVIGDPNCQRGKQSCDYFIPDCPVKCEWTPDRTRLGDANMVVFHADLGFKPDSPPFPEKVNKSWQKRVIFGHEPVWKRPMKWLNRTWMDHIDISLHWGRNADVPLTFYNLDKLGQPSSKRWWLKRTPRSIPDGIYETHERAVGGAGQTKAALTTYLVSNCNSKERMSLLERISAVLPTASFGKCLRNAVFPEDVLKLSQQKQKVALISRFPFHLTIESTANEAGWVTEKIYEALLSGTVPIYYGPQDIRMLAPPHSYIDATTFATPEDLARYVIHVYNNHTLYERYHEWRYADNVEDLFVHLERDVGRDTAACRLCQFYKEYRARERIDPFLNQKRLFYTKENGWIRAEKTDGGWLDDTYVPPRAKALWEEHHGHFDFTKAGEHLSSNDLL
eukprot:TRINITY_DN104_c0_g1_i1.p1 TRINITY_DN104_c0_g1~~TRINITY_DN104_c0_g1_i1.p1  ORF type:complete len:492 (+),score=75.63 TRINITY_DN104_c0_g1_i1:561-2036(+)